MDIGYCTRRLLSHLGTAFCPHIVLSADIPIAISSITRLVSIITHHACGGNGIFKCVCM
jgi:hypothetical protein